MPDITMCQGRDCPKREECYRYTAKPDPLRQSYAAFDMEEGECEYFYARVGDKLDEEVEG